MCGPPAGGEPLCVPCAEIASENRYKAWREFIDKLCESCQENVRTFLLEFGEEA